MELTKKGQEANIEVKQLKATMSWTSAVDFDLAAAYKKTDGETGVVYFNNQGDLNSFPFMKLDEDAGVGDTGGDNTENLTVTKIADEIEKIWFLSWDYGSITSAKEARFQNSDLEITIVDDNGSEKSVKLDTGETGNVTNLATIDNTGISAKLINSSEVTLWKEFPSSSKEIIEFCAN